MIAGSLDGTGVKLSSSGKATLLIYLTFTCHSFLTCSVTHSNSKLRLRVCSWRNKPTIWWPFSKSLALFYKFVTILNLTKLPALHWRNSRKLHRHGLMSSRWLSRKRSELSGGSSKFVKRLKLSAKKFWIDLRSWQLARDTNGSSVTSCKLHFLLLLAHWMRLEILHLLRIAPAIFYPRVRSDLTRNPS